MSTAREHFARLLAAYHPGLAQAQREGLARYLALVQDYSHVLNLTAFSTPDQLARELVGEALRLLDLGPLIAGAAVVDLGSGNGSPVVPLAIVCPEVRFTAVESRQRRSAFLRTVQALLGLANLEVWSMRTEDLARARPASFDIVTARAYAKPAALLAHARPLLKPGGEVRGFAGPSLDSVSAAASRLGCTLAAAYAYELGGPQRHVYRLVMDAARAV
jgi:16S rRNA (guanine527-N7)-methyltransferase